MSPRVAYFLKRAKAHMKIIEFKLMDMSQKTDYYLTSNSDPRMINPTSLKTPLDKQTPKNRSKPR